MPFLLLMQVAMSSSSAETLVADLPQRYKPLLFFRTKLVVHPTLMVSDPDEPEDQHMGSYSVPSTIVE